MSRGITRDWLENDVDKVKKKRTFRLSCYIRSLLVLPFAILTTGAIVFFGLLAGLYGVGVANGAVRYVGGLNGFLLFHDYKGVS